MSVIEPRNSDLPSGGLAEPNAIVPEGSAGCSELLKAVLEDYLAIQTPTRSRAFDLIQPVLKQWIQGSRELGERNRATGILFNPLTKIRIGETDHSRILGDLLNPDGSHGQGALFLNVFLNAINCPEWSPEGWQLSVETGRVDILLWRTHPERSSIIIENKANGAVDQLNQIYRYWHQEMYLWNRRLWDTPGEEESHRRARSFHIVYLTSDRERSPTGHSLERPADWSDNDNPHARVPLNTVTLSLQELTALWIDKTKPTIPATNSRIHDFLSQYNELWK